MLAPNGEGGSLRKQSVLDLLVPSFPAAATSRRRLRGGHVLVDGALGNGTTAAI